VRHIARADELANLSLAIGEFSDQTAVSVQD
jgi:hypothetical protein